MKSNTTPCQYADETAYFESFYAARAAAGDVDLVDWNGLIWRRHWSLLFAFGGRAAYSEGVSAETLAEAIAKGFAAAKSRHDRDMKLPGGAYTRSIGGAVAIGVDSRGEVAREYAGQGEMTVISAWERWVSPGHLIAYHIPAEVLSSHGLMDYEAAMATKF